MTCKLCKTKPVIQLVNSKITLCEVCFLSYIERKVKKTIRKYKLIQNTDKKIAVAVSGGKDSIVLIDILNKIIAKRKYPKLTAVILNEGIKGYSDYNVKFVKDYCKTNKIELKVFAFLDSLNIHYLKHNYIRSLHGIGRYKYHQFDVLYPLFKIAIDIHGCYWHACKQCNNSRLLGECQIVNVKRDKVIRETMRRYSDWKYLEIWQHDIENNFDKVKQQMLSLLNGDYVMHE